jgi:hypothetical protein
MSSLAAQQAALLDALLDWPADNATENIAAYARGSWARGLKAYQSNGHALAERTLQAAYPVLTQLLGEESQRALARAFWHAHPPARGDLAQWGGELEVFVRASAQLADEPYLADVVAAEWALHRCASAADRVADPSSFALLMAQDPAVLNLFLAPGCAVVRSPWPVASMVLAHLDCPAGHAPDLTVAGQRLRAGTAEDVVVWRAQFQPRLREGLPGEAQLLTALISGLSLGEALDAAPALDFNAWLPMAVQTHLLLGAHAQIIEI